MNDAASAGPKKMCVACQMDITGRRALPVKEDRIIRAIRAVKKSLGVAQNNLLFVCESCMAKHNERRRSFEKTLLFASVLAGIMLVLLILVPLLSGRFEAWALLSGIIVAGFIIFIPIMFKYVPAVEGFASSIPPSSQVRLVPPMPAVARGQPGSQQPAMQNRAVPAPEPKADAGGASAPARMVPKPAPGKGAKAKDGGRAKKTRKK